MAKSSGSRTGNSKIRFIMLEADLNDADLSQVTQAIQNALKPASSTIKMIQTPSTTNAGTFDVDDSNFEEVMDDEDLGSESTKPKTIRSGKPRVAKTPTVLNDIDVNTDPSLKAFVEQFDITTGVDKYLVIALWFRDARNIENITVDHVYTCFKLLSWSTGANDFSKPLRNLRDEQSLRGGAKEGYSLTLPGAAKIEAKKRSA